MDREDPTASSEGHLRDVSRLDQRREKVAGEFLG